MKTKVILFGAGVYAKKYAALLEYLEMDFQFFTDNDTSKWGKKLYGKEIISPQKLIELQPIQIIISSTHEIAIREQLEQMGLGDSVIGLNELYQQCEKRADSHKISIQKKSAKRSILVDMYEGIGWGGTELWAANLAYGLRQVGEQVVLIGGTEQPALQEKYECMVQRISEQETILHMEKLFEENLPCTFINNFAGCAFMAAVIVKQKYPDLVQIVSVVHNDNKSLFDAHMMLGKYIDKIFCVSNQILEHMCGLYSVDRKKYVFKEQPIDCIEQYRKIYNKKDSLRIGYAARLVKQQKRADLLVDLLEQFEKRKIDYRLQIAGDGECFELISEYINQRELVNKVQLLGRLEKNQMNDFWKEQDVFINISEYEGTSLSMLEAMSFGVVPIVTDVSGAREFIGHNGNGFIVDIGDLQGIVNYVELLDRDREKLQAFGDQNINLIRKRCNSKAYIEFWLEKLLVDNDE